MDLQEYKDTDSIDELWQKACQNFAKLTDRPLKKAQSGVLRSIDAREQVDTTPLLDQAVEQLRLEHEHADSNASSKKAQAKHCARNVLNFVLLIGGIAAGAASSAFPPASTCWSAAEFLLQIPGKIDKYYAGVSDIFKEMDGHLLTLGVYKRMDSKRIEPELHRSIHRVLISFVDICARAYCFTRGGKRDRFWKVTKSVLADDDSGISESLKEFRHLLKAMSHVESAAILASGLRVEAHTERTEGKVDDIGIQVNELASAEREKSLESEWKEQIQQIVKTLGLDQQTLDEQEKAHRRHTAKLLPKSIGELRASMDYGAWFDFESDSHPLLLLEGAARSGKSHTASAIIDEVEYSNRSIESQKKATPLIAHFFFQSKAERGEKENVEQQKGSGQMLDKALKHMCVQIAKAHRPFCREISRYCYGKKLADFQDKSCHELWEMLKLASPRGSSVHLLVFDGIEMLPASVVTELLTLLARQRSTSSAGSSAGALSARLRIVATIQEDMVTSVAVPPGVLRCDMADYSRGNAIKIIDDHFLKTTGAWDVSDESKKDFVQRVTDKMLEVGRCNFGYIEKRLKLINESYHQNENLEDAYETLEENLEEDPDKYAVDMLAHLNTDLSTTEIERLNWLIAWIMYSPVYFTVEELKAVMYLQSRNKLDVKRRLNQYPKIFSVNDFDYVVIDDALDDYLRSNQLPRSSSDGFALNEAYVTMEVKIHHASINAVRKMMWSLSEPNALENLLAGTGQKHERGRAVGVNRIEARLTILDRFLEILVDEPEETTELLVDSAVEFIVKDALAFDEERLYKLLTPQDKMQIQKTLLTVLCDVHILEKYDILGVDMREWWLREMEDIARLDAWLHDDEATSHLDPRDRRRLDRLLRDAAKCNVRLWHRVTVAMATRWLVSDRGTPGDAYCWVEKYLSLHGEVDSAELKQLLTTIEWNTPSTPESGDARPLSWLSLTPAKQIEVAVAWSRANIPKHKENSLWFRRLAEVYLERQRYPEAIQTFQKSLALPGHHWLSNVGLANALYDNEQTTEAQAEMEKVIAIADTQVDLDESEAERLTGSLLKFALWQIPSDAIQTCQRAIGIGKTEFDYRFHFRLIVAFQRHDQVTDAKGHILDLHSKRAQNGDFTRLAGALEFWAEQHPTLSIAMDNLVYLLDDVEVRNAVETGLKQASQFAQQKQLPLAQAKCELLRALLLFQGDDGLSSLKQSLEICKQLCRPQNESDPIDWRDKTPYDPVELGLHCIFEIARLEGVEKASLEPFAEELTEILEKLPVKSPYVDWVAAVFLARCRIIEDRIDKARDCLMRLFNDALDLLSDDDETNDHMGFYLLARVLNHVGDEVNSLQAWALITPLSPAWHDPQVDLEASNGDGGPAQLVFEGSASTLDGSVGMNGHLGNLSQGQETRADGSSPYSDDVEESIKSPELLQDPPSPLAKHAADRSSITEKRAELESLGWLRVAKDDVNLRYLQQVEADGKIEFKEDADPDQVQLRGTQMTITDLLSGSQMINNNPKHYPLTIWCAGNCSRSMHFPNGFNYCRYCAQAVFCDTCFEKLKQGKQKHMLCRPTHEWLKLPAWSWDEYRRRGANNVWADGKIREEDGVVVGTEKVHWQVWLNGIRKQWGVPEVEVKVKTRVLERVLSR